MRTTHFQRLGRRLTALSVSVLATAAAPAAASPQGQGRGGGPPAPTESATVVPFVDPATLVRDMTRQQVTAGGKTEQKVVVPAKYCAGLAPNASKSVTLPDLRWGIRTTTPVPVTRRTKATLQWPGHQKRDETLPDGMPGSAERAFAFTRPGPRSIRVTLLPVGGGSTQVQLGDGSVRRVTDGTSNTVAVGETAARRGTAPAITDGTSNTIMVGEASRPSSTVCVSDTFVSDPPVEVLIDVTGPPGQAATSRRTTF